MKSKKQLDADIAQALARHGGAKKRGADLYEIAENLRAKTPSYRQIYFEEGPGEESLWFDTFPGKLYIMPYKQGRRLRKGETISDATDFHVGFSWNEADVEMGSYKTSRGAVKRAMELALWGEDDVKEAFGISPYAPY